MKYPSLVETICFRTWKKSSYAECSLSVSVGGSKTSIAQALYYLRARTERAANGQTLKSCRISIINGWATDQKTDWIEHLLKLEKTRKVEDICAA